MKAGKYILGSFPHSWLALTFKFIVDISGEKNLLKRQEKKTSKSETGHQQLFQRVAYKLLV